MQYDFVVPGQIVKSLYCVDTLRRLPDPPELKMAVQGRTLNGIITIQANSQASLGECHTVHFTDCFERWYVRLADSTMSDGDYFEGGDVGWRIKGKPVPVHTMNAFSGFCHSERQY